MVKCQKVSWIGKMFNDVEINLYLFAQRYRSSFKHILKDKKKISVQMHTHTHTHTHTINIPHTQIECNKERACLHVHIYLSINLSLFIPNWNVNSNYEYFESRLYSVRNKTIYLSIYLSQNLSEMYSITMIISRVRCAALMQFVNYL